MEWVEYQRHVSAGKWSGIWSFSDAVTDAEAQSNVRNRGTADQESRRMRDQLGELMTPMLIEMAARGPESAGMAVFTRRAAGRSRAQDTACIAPSWGD